MSRSKFSDVSDFRFSLQESLSSNPGLWDEVLGDRQLDLQEDAEAACHSLLEDGASLERVLVARHRDAEGSTALFWEQVAFRARYRPESIDAALRIPTALPSGAWRLCGNTRDGHVVSNYKLRHWDPDAYDDDLDKAVQEYIYYICYMVELMIRRGTKHHRFCIIFDLAGFSVSMAFKKNMQHMVYHLIYVAQAQYPERLERVFVVNAPWSFSTAWNLIAKLLDKKTCSKIQFCSSVEELLEDIDVETLSRAYGGTHEEYPIPTGKE